MTNDAKLALLAIGGQFVNCATVLRREIEALTEERNALQTRVAYFELDQQERGSMQEQAERLILQTVTSPRIASLTAERDRMRAALEAVVAWEDGFSNTPPLDQVRAALGKSV